MDSREAWEKFIETGRVDYYLMSRGIDVYAEGYVKRPPVVDSAPEEPDGGEVHESGGFGDRAESQPLG